MVDQTVRDYSEAITPARIVELPPFPGKWYDDMGAAMQETEAAQDAGDYGAFDRGIDLIQSLGGAYMMKSGQQVEDWPAMDTLGKWLFSTGEEIYEENIEAASQLQRKRLEQTEGFGEKAEWFVDTLKEQAPMIMTPLAGALIGGVALSKLLMLVPNPIVRKLAPVGGKVAGAWLASYVLNTGDAYSSQLQAGGRIDEGVADKAGMVAALLDIIVPTWIVGRWGLGNRLKRDLTKNILNRTELGKRILRGMGLMVTEGATEGAQEAIIEASVNFVNELPMWEFSEEQKAIIREALYAGTAVGSVAAITPMPSYTEEEITPPEVELPPMTVPEGPRTLGGFPPPITPQGYESTVTMDTPQYGAETAEGTIVQPLGQGAFSVTSVTTPQFDPIEKVVPTDDEAVNMDGVTDAVDNKAATVGGPRTLSKKDKRKLNKQRAKVAKEAEAQRKKDEAEAEKLRIDRAETAAHTFFSSQMDAGIDLEEALDASEAQEQAIRDDPALGNSTADIFRKVYTRRWSAENSKRKRRGQFDAASLVQAGPAKPGAPSTDVGKTDAPSPREKAEKIPVDRVSIPNTSVAAPVSAVKNAEGKWDLKVGDETIRTYDSAQSARRTGKELTEDKVDKFKEQLKSAQEPKVTKAPPTQVEKDEAQAKADTKKQEAVDKAAEQKAAGLEALAKAADAKKKTDADKEAADLKKKAQEDERIRREKEIADKAIKKEEAEATPINQQKAAERKKAGKMTASEKRLFLGSSETAGTIAEKNNYATQYGKLDTEGKNNAIEAFKDALRNWVAGDISKQAVDNDWTWEEFVKDAVIGDIDTTLEVMAEETAPPKRLLTVKEQQETMTAEEIEAADRGGIADVDEAFLTEGESRMAAVQRKRDEGKDTTRALGKKKTKPKAGTRGAEFPTDPEVVSNLDPDTFLEKVDNTKSKGGYELGELRKLAAAIPGMNQKLSREGLVEELKLWYGRKNNSKDTLADEDLKTIVDEGYDIIEEDGILQARHRGLKYRGIGMFGEGTEEARPMESSEIRGVVWRDLKSMFDEESIKIMNLLGFINFVKFAELPSIIGKRRVERSGIGKDTYAFSDNTTGRIYFIVDNMSAMNITSFHVRGLILHEIAVHFGKNILSSTEWTNVKKALLNLYVQNDERVVIALNTAAERLSGAMKRAPEIIGGRDEYIHPDETGVNFWIDAETRFDIITEFDKLFNETLAYFASQNPSSIKVGPAKKLWIEIEQAVRKFFLNLLKKFNPKYKGESKITSTDIEYLISHLAMHIPDVALKRFGDTHNIEHIRTSRREKFLEDSVITKVQYHGTMEDFSFPVFGVTDLGMHFGTQKAAMNRVAGLEKDSEKSEAMYQEIASLIRPMGIFSPLFRAYVKGYYINIKNPLVVPDLGVWDNPRAWYNYTFKDEALNTLPDNVSPFVMGKWRTFISKWAKIQEDGMEQYPEQFREQFIEFWEARGFDGIKYRNIAEDQGSISYMVFREEQISPENSYSFNSSSKGINLIRGIGGTEADNIAGNRGAARFAADTVRNTFASEGRARTAWDNLRRFFDPFATVGGRSLLLIRRYLARGEATLGENTAKNIFDIFEQANAAEEKNIYKFFTTEGASPNLVPNRNVQFKTRETIFRGRRIGKAGGRQVATVNMREKAIEVKEQIESMGRELVDLQLMSETRFERLRGKYLPKMYLRYLLGDEYRSALGSGMRPGRMDYVKIRKLHSKWMADVILGEIKDPAFLASKYIGTVSRDLAMVKYLNYVVSDPGNNGWVLPDDLVQWRDNTVSIYWLESEATHLQAMADVREKTDPSIATEMRDAAKEMRNLARSQAPSIAKYRTGKYKQIPNQPKFGSMRGIWVLKEIHDDVMGWIGPTGEQPIVAQFFSATGIGGWAQRYFKYSRVIANPPTLIRNLISNTVLLQTSGVSMFKIPSVMRRAMEEILTDGYYYKLAQKYGVESASFTSEEIRSIDREYAKLSANASWQSRAALFLSDANVGGRFYQKSEVLFKVAKMVDLMENKGMSEGQAALESQEAILDYSLVSPSIRFLRSVPFGAPFITFQIKVLPQLLKNLRKHPLSFAPYVALPYVMAGIFAAENDVDEDDLKKLRQHMGEWARDRTGMFFLPSRNEDGKWVAVDIGYMLPWTAWIETARDMYKLEFGDAWQGTGFFSGPVDILKGLEANQDPFTQQPIWSDLDPPQQRYEDMLVFMASYMVPPFMNPRGRAGAITTGGGAAVKLLMAAGMKDGNIGEDGLPKYDISASILAMFGVNTYTLNPAFQLQRNLRWMTTDLNKTMSRMMKMITDPGISAEKREQLMQEYLVFIQNKQSDIMEYVESTRGMSEKLQ